MSEFERTHARATDPVTSHEAAGRAEDKVRYIRERIYRLYYNRHPEQMTWKDVHRLCPEITRDNCWKRVSELSLETPPRLYEIHDEEGNLRKKDGCRLMRLNLDTVARLTPREPSLF